jgi:hypothetical protein
MSRPRFTLRRLMVVVASFAVIFGSVPMCVRSLEYSRMAEDQARIEGWYGGPAIESQPLANKQPRDEWASTCRDIAAKSRVLRLKYERAALYPWLPVEPDPPKPE